MTTKAPRSRVGLSNKPHNVYPGGKHLRKALHRLNLRKTGAQSGKRPDRLNYSGDQMDHNRDCFTEPGSMK